MPGSFGDGMEQEREDSMLRQTFLPTSSEKWRTVQAELQAVGCGKQSVKSVREYANLVSSWSSTLYPSDFGELIDAKRLEGGLCQFFETYRY